MPSIPNYNQGATEEAGLTRAKRRVIGFMEQGNLTLTEKPAVDLSNGKAEDLAVDIVKQMEEITSTLRQGNLFFEDLGDEIVVDDYNDAKKAMKFVIIARKLAIRLMRDLKRLLKGNSVSYIALGTFADLQTAWEELKDIFMISTTYLTNVGYKFVEEIDDEYDEEDEEEDDEEIVLRKERTDDNFKRIAGYEDLTQELIEIFYEIGLLIIAIKSNFNQARQQRVSAPEEIPDEKSGGRFRKPLYRIGNNVMGAMYELDGLPRFI
jgi:hypothetical protein